MHEHVFVAWMPADECQYAYLVGLYLGDGYVGEVGRTSQISFSLDDVYPSIVEKAVGAIRSCARNKVTCRRPAGQAYTVVSSYGPHWLETFPQHGLGPKHERPIVLADWQRTIVDAHHNRSSAG